MWVGYGRRGLKVERMVGEGHWGRGYGMVGGGVG